MADPEYDVDCPLCGATQKARLGPSGKWYAMACPACMYRAFFHVNSPAITAGA